MTSSELRKKFLEFFEEQSHKIIPSASLIPTDSSVLFTTAGMQPLTSYLLGEKHLLGKRLASIQKCLRTDDIDEVGDDTHNTFFEMLGNWSLGDYWKKDSIRWSLDFLTKKLGLPKEKLAVSCFKGDEISPKDEKSSEIWESLGIGKKRIKFLSKKDNWWGPVGNSGPCGPDTEIFYWKSKEIPPPEYFNPEDKNWVEVWNNVFMQYVKTADGKYLPAEQKNVDTGMGLERTLAIINDKESVYETDLFSPIMSLIPDEVESRKKRIIADHSRAVVFLISDGVRPSNKDQGYILRRLARRILAEEFLSKKKFLENVLEKIILDYQVFYPELKMNSKIIMEEFLKEKNKFSETLERGMNELMKEKKINAMSAFVFYQSYGLPYDIIKNFASDINREDFEKEIKKHQELSRSASAGMFKGGLADDKPETIRLHTAHHLLLAALQEIFGKSVKQRGSNINSERLRMDFSFDRKLTDKEKDRIEDIVNDKIKKRLDVVKKEIPKEEAEKIDAEMEFGVKYGNVVSVYFIQDKEGNIFSKEFCGGPHIGNTSELGNFKIVKEEASSSGTRRIKAILE